MEGIFTLGHHSPQSLIDKIGGTYFELPNKVDDSIIHDYLVSHFKDLVVNVLIIDLNDAKEVGLASAMHFRLSPSLLKENTLAPIVFVLDDDISSYLNTPPYSQLFLTSGISYSTSEDVVLSIDAVKKLSVSEYITNVLGRLRIISPGGRHSLANQWGASVLGGFVNKRIVSENEEIVRASKSLYFKWTDACSRDSRTIFSDESFTGDNEKCLNASGRKILLIDDEAERGWKDILSSFFRDADCFHVISHSFATDDDLTDDEVEMIEKNDYDLIFLDLRLNGVEEENVYSVNDFSGWKVLQLIKNYNPGIQIIMFTATNKVWNIKALLDGGADGYYIKESPESHSLSFSRNNYSFFKETVDRCLSRGFLRKVWNEIEIIQKRKSNISKNSYSNVLKQLELAYTLWSKATSLTNPKSQEAESMFSFTYISLFSILETIVKDYIDEDTLKFRKDQSLVPNWVIKNNGFEKKGLPDKNSFSIGKKVIAIYKYTNHSISYQKGAELLNITRLRNNYVHNVQKSLPCPLIPMNQISCNDGCLQAFNAITSVIKEIG